jgi:hypothetical protein
MRDQLSMNPSIGITQKYNIKVRRAYELLQGRWNPSEMDIPFVNACYDRALVRKQMADRFSIFLR